MNHFFACFPITTTYFDHLWDQTKRPYFVINAHDSNFVRQLKEMEKYPRKVVIGTALCVSLVAIPLFLALDGSLHLLAKMNLRIYNPYQEDFHYLFTSSVFVSHYEQLKLFTRLLQTDTADSLNEFYHYILNPGPLSNENERRQFHQVFIDTLRKLLNFEEGSPEREGAKKMCRWLYTGPNLLDSMVEFIRKEFPRHSKYDILELNTQLSRHPKLTGISAESRLYDPSYLGDLPSCLYEYPIETKKIKIIRTPAVTKDLERNRKGDLVKAAIVEEFLGFLENYQSLGKKHLYINLMKRHGSEGIRSKLIESYEDIYEGSFHVISLDKDSRFYWQTGKYSKLSNADNFKLAFIDKMFELSDFHWPPALGEGWRGECSRIIKIIHTNHFNSKSDLTKQERIDFIELVYAELIDAALKKLQPDSANISCKSCIDRGASALAMHYGRVEKLNTFEKRSQFAAIALAPAILAMNRVIDPSRIPCLDSFIRRSL